MRGGLSAWVSTISTSRVVGLGQKARPTIRATVAQAVHHEAELMLGASRLDLVKYNTLEVCFHVAVTFNGTLAPPASPECGLVKEGHVGLNVLWDGFPELGPCPKWKLAEM